MTASMTRSTQPEMLMLVLRLCIRLRVHAHLYMGTTRMTRSTRLKVGKGEEMPEETVFGLRPAERNEAARLQPQLRMYGEELLQDTMDIGTRLARAGRIEESPTPWGTGGAGRSGDFHFFSLA
jgi:hypothetical protein